MTGFTTCLWVMLGSALGGMGRYACSRHIAKRLGETFPWGTLAVNFVGSFAIGFFDALTDAAGALGVAPDVRQFVVVGICGGFTTFSSFSLQTLELVRNRDFAEAIANIVLSVGLCLFSVLIGYGAARTIG